VEEARRRIVEAMELFVNDSRKTNIVDEVKLPATVARVIRTYATLHKSAEHDDRLAAMAARRAVGVMRGGRLKMSAGDAARLLGLSHQRVHQLTRNEAEDR
jgi:hypothetical protein